MTTVKRIRAQARARMAQCRQAVISAGGSYISSLLGAEATAALERISAGTTKRAAIEAAIIKMDRENNE